MEKFDIEVCLMRSVHKDLQFLIFLVFNKNEALKGLLGITLPYNQLNICVLATLCAIFMPLASKLWHSQWFEVGQLAMTKSFFGQIWLFDHERSPVGFQTAMQTCSASKNT